MTSALETARQRYIPEGALKIAHKATKAVVYLYVNKDGQPTFQAYRARSQKPVMWLRYQTTERRDARVRQFLESEQAKYESQQRRKAERFQPHNLEPGVLFYTSWGYDQTNVTFYEVSKIVGKNTVALQELGSQRANESEGYSHGMADHAVPDQSRKIGKPQRYRVDMEGGTPSMKIHCSAWARIWDGKPLYRSWYA